MGTLTLEVAERVHQRAVEHAGAYKRFVLESVEADALPEGWEATLETLGHTPDEFQSHLGRIAMIRESLEAQKRVPELKIEERNAELEYRKKHNELLALEKKLKGELEKASRPLPALRQLRVALEREWRETTRETNRVLAPLLARVSTGNLDRLKRDAGNLWQRAEKLRVFLKGELMDPVAKGSAILRTLDDPAEDKVVVYKNRDWYQYKINAARLYLEKFKGGGPHNSYFESQITASAPIVARFDRAESQLKDLMAKYNEAKQQEREERERVDAQRVDWQVLANLIFTQE